MKTVFKRILPTLTLLCTFPILANYIDRFYWFFELISSIKYHFLILIFLGSVWMFIFKQYRYSIASLFFCLINLLPLLNYYIKPNFNISTSNNIKIISSNVLYLNKDVPRIINFIKNEDPDIIYLAESYKYVVDSIVTELPQYTNYEVSIDRGDFGTAMLSKIPNVTFIKKHFGSNPYASIIGEFNINGKPLTIIGTHPYPALTSYHALNKSTNFKELSNYIKQKNSTTVLLGDFNTTSNSYIFKDLLKVANMYDSRLGYGIQNSFPYPLPAFLRISIDHAVLTKDIVVNNRKLGNHIGSDHYPIVLDVSF